MRQIVFRGRCFNSPTWVYGLPYIEGIDTNGEKWVSIRQPKENGGFTSYKVDPETIGQFTGLYDVKNNEIYEGDIFKFGNLEGVITWHPDGYWCIHEGKYDIKNRSYRSLGEMIKYLNERDLYCEVIGNIYDKNEQTQTK